MFKIKSVFRGRKPLFLAAGLAGACLVLGPIANAATTSDVARLKLTSVDGDIVAVSARSFPANAQVVVKATVSDGTLEGSGTMTADAEGRFLAAFLLPSATFNGKIVITATSGDIVATKTLTIGTGVPPTTKAPATTVPPTVTTTPATTTPTTEDPSTEDPVETTVPATPTTKPPTATTAPAAGVPTTPGIPGTWKLAFNDEFAGTKLDLTKWFMCNPSFGSLCNPWNGEKQKFNTAQTGNKNVVVSGGQLHLVATNDGGQIMSGMVSTGPLKWGYKQEGYKGFQFTYGYYEGRVKLPKGNGHWPSMWMLPDQDKYGKWPDSGEYDVFEIPTNNPTEYHFTSHWGGGGGVCGHPCTPQEAKISDATANWHTYGLDWEKTGLTWYVDGKKMGNTVTDAGAIKNTPFYIIANHSVGGTWGPLNGGGGGPFPASMDIDYLRVWQH